jgi:predicted O-methyltransferase YrrM
MCRHNILFNYFIHLIDSLSGRANDPFIHDFSQNILNNKTVYSEFDLIEKYRSVIYTNDTPLETKDFGAGTKSDHKRGTIGSMAKVASVNAKYGRFLFHLVRYYQPDRILELGTAVGISTMYLAWGNPQARVITVEGNPQLAVTASRNFTLNGLHNIILIKSTFDNAMTQLLSEVTNNTLVFIDGNHTLKATLQYFEVFGKKPDSYNIMIFDDINWSHEMMQAWKSITLSAHSGVSVDLFRMGILFQGRGKNGQKFRLRY